MIACVDGTDIGAATMGYALAFAHFVGAPVIAVHTPITGKKFRVTEAAHASDRHEHGADQQERQMIELTAAARRRFPGVLLSHVVTRLGPGRALLERSALADAQLIVTVAARGRLSARLHDLPSLSLLEQSACPIMIVPAP
ncbi:universal stress protein [Rhodococcus opacus]|uniref:universal stress protein n=1 Tax=Rhodococcus opacus TaxID=37919 RepID=UPI002235744A|nr:universal stress protein [Rhodococcus opacus]UZG55283.1 universal stress protein [Rhodococcus opacus]